MTESHGRGTLNLPEGSRSEAIRRIRWLRHHGPTAFSSGILPLSLSIQIQPHAPNQMISSSLRTGTTELYAQHGGIDTFRRLIDLFVEQFGCQYPFLTADLLRQMLDAHGEESFLLNCVAALAASHSDDPRVAVQGSPKHENGLPWYNRARSMMGMVMGIPLRETIMGFVLLAAVNMAGVPPGESWMTTGIAVRMAGDLGLHLKEMVTDSSESLSDSQVFGNVLMRDLVVSLGVGRPTAFRLEEITRTYRHEGESLFECAVSLMLAHAKLVNHLNMRETEGNRGSKIQRAKQELMDCYNELPQSMRWNAKQYRVHYTANSGSAFLEMHLWAMAMLTMSSDISSSMEMIELANAVDASTLLTLPFIAHPLYRAATILVDQIEELRGVDVMGDMDQCLWQSFRQPCAQKMVAVLQQALDSLGDYYHGVKWISNALTKRLQGVQHPPVDTQTGSGLAQTVFEYALPRRYRENDACVN
ncbi:hypothetical protein BD324DRAFT_650626 [Kockovaella imperatae]|uniref:Xylanolytic transcriptional activator regulatory domain-containing protein n=1 Tax=Kockovaella imperatae TaxID=4999 RepID=A0A1Y1UG22_9TREE|nr:hypothetical protein BD324DRAFT_650626 [Kockovaella imperatae]ORX37011.1 hypothetical protein BD324DRAFT_650626 [Kockovaella imperatae]